MQFGFELDKSEFDSMKVEKIGRNCLKNVFCSEEQFEIEFDSLEDIDKKVTKDC